MTKVHFRSYIHKKMILFPQRIDKDIAEDDPVRLLDALVDNLMLDNVYKLYKPSGRKPYHPQMMLKVVLYAYMNNIYSCRRIESLLKRDIHFIYLAGYEQPDFITINRFRNRVKKDINNYWCPIKQNIIKPTRDSGILEKTRSIWTLPSLPLPLT